MPYTEATSADGDGLNMRENAKAMQSIELSFDRRQAMAIIAGSLLILGTSFILGLKVGGKRIFILADASSSMLAEDIVNAVSAELRAEVDQEKAVAARKEAARRRKWWPFKK